VILCLTLKLVFEIHISETSRKGFDILIKVRSLFLGTGCTKIHDYDVDAKEFKEIHQHPLKFLK